MEIIVLTGIPAIVIYLYRYLSGRTYHDEYGRLKTKPRN